MATLFKYLKDVQRLLREQHQVLMNVGNLIDYINDARREVAGRTQCIRRLTPISGQIMSANVVAGGSGYSPATAVTISPPDFPSGRQPNPSGKQATALPILSGGAISSVMITYGGDGYFSPQATITDGAGTGASVMLNMSPLNLLLAGQEVYPFSDIFLGNWPGVASVYAIHSVSVIYSNYRYSLPCYAFSVYQAKIRQYPFQYQYVPAFCSQFGQGTDGSFYVYPLPSQTYQIEYDCYCLPIELEDDQSVDVIPSPWDDVVKFYAAHLAYLDLQNYNAANYYMQLFDNMTLRKSQYARPGRAISPYGRY
jgi:hypothetical protein